MPLVDGNRDIYVYTLFEGVERLTDHAAEDGYPVWSPDGTHIAFHSNRDGDTHDIYTLRLSDRQTTRLTNSGANDWGQSWSPDGKKIAFISYRDDVNKAEIYVMDSDGSNPINISQSAANERDPAWAGNSTHIAFTSDSAGNDDIYVMLADGRDVQQITSHSASDSRPCLDAD